MIKSKRIRSFDTKDRFGDVRLSIYEDYIEIREKGGLTFKRSFEDVIYKSPFSLTSELRTEYEITRLAIHYYKKVHASKKERLGIAFYKHFEPKKITAFEYDYTFKDKYGNTRTKLEFSPFGLKVRAAGQMRYAVKSDRLLFAGPYTESLPLEKRIEIRNLYFQALGEQNDISLEDCYPIIDYDALESERFKLTFGDYMSGSELTIENGYVHYTGWSSPRDGGAKSFPIEWFLFYDEDFFNLLTNNQYTSSFTSFKELIRKHSIIK